MVKVEVKSSTSEQWADGKSLMVQPCKLVQQRWHSQQLRVIIWISVYFSLITLIQKYQKIIRNDIHKIQGGHPPERRSRAGCPLLSGSLNPR